MFSFLQLSLVIILTWAFRSSNRGLPLRSGTTARIPPWAGTLGTRSVPGRVRGGHPASLRPLSLAVNSGFRPGRDGGRRGQEAWARGPGGTPGPPDCTAASVAAGGARAGGAAALLPLAGPPPHLLAQQARACMTVAFVLEASELGAAASFTQESGGNSARLRRSLGSTLAGARQHPRYP